MIDSAIPLQVKPPEAGPSVVQTLGSLMSLRNAGAEYALRQAQAADAKAQADQRAADLHDQGVITGMLQDPEKAKRYAAGDYSDIQGLVQPKTLDAISKVRDEHVTKQLANTKEQNALFQNHTAEVAKGLNSLDEYVKASDAHESELPGMYSSWLANVKNEGLLDFMAPGTELPTTLTDPAQLRKMIAALGMHHEALTQALAVQKDREDIATKQQTREDAAAKAERERIDFDTQQPVKAAIAQDTLANEKHLTPEQQEKADEAAATLAAKPVNAGTAESQFVTEYQTQHPGSTIAQAQRAFKVNEHIPSEGDTTAALDRESKRFAAPHEASLKAANDQLDKITEAKSLITGSASAQALGLPKVLSAVVGGAGSGLRMTESELNRIGQPLGITGRVESWIDSTARKGAITKTEQQQLSEVLDRVAQRLQQKRELANEALDKINGAHSRDEIVKIDSELRHKLADMSAGNDLAGATHALPSVGDTFHGGKVLKIEKVQ